MKYNMSRGGCVQCLTVRAASEDQSVCVLAGSSAAICSCTGCAGIRRKTQPAPDMRPFRIPFISKELQWTGWSGMFVLTRAPEVLCSNAAVCCALQKEIHIPLTFPPIFFILWPETLKCVISNFFIGYKHKVGNNFEVTIIHGSHCFLLLKLRKVFCIFMFSTPKTPRPQNKTAF